MNKTKAETTISQNIWKIFFYSVMRHNKTPNNFLFKFIQIKMKLELILLCFEFFSGMNNWVKNYVEFNDYSEMTGIPTKMAMVLGSAAASYLALEYFGGGKCHSDAKMNGKTVVITGCNTGIGKETARDLSKRGAKIIMACRNLELAEKAAEEIRESTKGEIVVKKLDLANLASVREFAKEVFFLSF